MCDACTYAQAIANVGEEGEEDEREVERRQDACNLDRGHLLRATERGGA